jgi:hypothetical protein
MDESRREGTPQAVAARLRQRPDRAWDVPVEVEEPTFRSLRETRQRGGEKTTTRLFIASSGVFSILMDRAGALDRTSNVTSPNSSCETRAMGYGLGTLTDLQSTSVLGESAWRSQNGSREFFAGGNLKENTDRMGRHN